MELIANDKFRSTVDAELDVELVEKLVKRLKLEQPVVEQSLVRLSRRHERHRSRVGRGSSKRLGGDVTSLRPKEGAGRCWPRSRRSNRGPLPRS